MTDFTESNARELFERLKREDECWHYNEKFSASAYLCDGCGFESTHGTIQNHNPNLTTPDADTMLWMMERATAHNDELSIGFLRMEDSYECFIDQRWCGSPGETIVSYPLAIRNALYQYFNIGGG